MAAFLFPFPVPCSPSPPRLRPSTDVRPVTEFRANASAFLEQVQVTKRPVVLTQHGRSAAVLLDVGVYEELLDELALLRDIRTAESEVARGKGSGHSAVVKRLRARAGR
jgi:antitoxin YefM